MIRELEGIDPGGRVLKFRNKLKGRPKGQLDTHELNSIIDPFISSISTPYSPSNTYLVLTGRFHRYKTITIWPNANRMRYYMLVTVPSTLKVSLACSVQLSCGPQATRS